MSTLSGLDSDPPFSQIYISSFVAETSKLVLFNFCEKMKTNGMISQRICLIRIE